MIVVLLMLLPACILGRETPHGIFASTRLAFHFLSFLIWCACRSSLEGLVSRVECTDAYMSTV